MLHTHPKCSDLILSIGGLASMSLGVNSFAVNELPALACRLLCGPAGSQTGAIAHPVRTVPRPELRATDKGERMAKRYSVSRWNATRPLRPARNLAQGWNDVPSMREVRNTDGELLRKVEQAPRVGMAPVTSLQFRTGARVVCGKLTGGKHTKRPAYYAESGEKAACLCAVAGSARCPVAGHAKRAVPAPKAWGDPEPEAQTGVWDPVTGRPLDALANRLRRDGRVVQRHPSGARLVNRR